MKEGAARVRAVVSVRAPATQPATSRVSRQRVTLFAKRARGVRSEYSLRVPRDGADVALSGRLLRVVEAADRQTPKRSRQVRTSAAPVAGDSECLFR
jgi:hypothetical protein